MVLRRAMGYSLPPASGALKGLLPRTVNFQNFPERSRDSQVAPSKGMDS